MLITRRNLLLSATGAAAMTPMFPRLARATNSSSRDAVTFNKTFLTRAANTPLMPSGLYQKGIIAVNWRCTTLPPANSAGVIIQTNDTTANGLFCSAQNSAGNLRLVLTINGPTGNDNFNIIGPVAVLGAWIQDVIAFDLSVPQAKWLSNGTPVAPIISSFGSNWAVNYAQSLVVGAAYVSGKTAFSPYLGDMAELALWANGYVDPTDPAVLPIFYDVNNELPIRIGPVGWTTLGDFNLSPQIVLSGPASQFMQNLTACTFDSGVSANPGQFYDTNPTSMFTQTGGTALITALSDPWSDPA